MNLIQHFNPIEIKIEMFSKMDFILRIISFLKIWGFKKREEELEADKNR